MIAWLARHRAPLALTALLLAGAIISQSVAERSQPGPALSSRDAGDTGALATFLWLERLGYDVGRVEHGGAALDSTQLLFLLHPIRGYAQDEAQSLLDWVRRGGVLVYAPSATQVSALEPTPNREPLASGLDIAPRFGPSIQTATATLPFFTAPPARDFRLDTFLAFELGDPAWVPLIEQDGRTYAATRQLGSGQVYAISGASLFANNHVADRDNPAFVLNVLAHHPAVHTVGFEEDHHNLLATPDLTDAMRDSPWGWAVWYAVLGTFLFLLWGGRRFGPALVAERGPRRSTGEYVEAFSGLLQRARAGAWVQEQYARLVRHRLARLLAVRADLPAAELARLVGERHPIDESALAAQLAALDGPPLGDRSLLGEVRAVEGTLRNLRGWES
ncbi:MAG: hypothetical protein QOF51_3503 [Chloroflexota bacterium]|nr:hypothetical protein [Chloroflexota bacterium]